MTTSNIDRITLGVIFGGAGPEHEASLSSAAALLKHVDQNKFDVKLFGIEKDGHWIIGPGTWDSLYSKANEQLLPSNIRNQAKNNNIDHCTRISHFPPYEMFQHVDCIFPLVHGLGGEDGSLRGLLSFTSKPVVGCSIASSVQSYKKYTAKRLVEAVGIRTAKAILVQGWLTYEQAVDLIARKFEGNWSLIVKPNASGSSFGVSRITEEAELREALNSARQYDCDIIIEEYIKATELFVGVMGREPDVIVAAPVVDSPRRQGLYTYSDKYISGIYENNYLDASEHEIERKAREIAERVYKELDCDSYARVDLFYHENGEFYFNELNSPPAFSPECAFARGMAKFDYSYDKIIMYLVKLALDRNSDPSAAQKITQAQFRAA